MRMLLRSRCSDLLRVYPAAASQLQSLSAPEKPATMRVASVRLSIWRGPMSSNRYRRSMGTLNGLELCPTGSVMLMTRATPGPIWFPGAAKGGFCVKVVLWL